MKRLRPALLVTAALALSLPTLLGATAAEGATTWAPVDTAAIHPGVQTLTDGGQCTANFVFTDGTDVYIGQAAHCSGTGEATDTNGCTAGTQPLGTPVTILGSDGNEYAGTLAYSSWNAMQDATVAPSADACAYNDFALVKIDAGDHDKVNPSIPVFGGPHGVDANGAAAGEQVYTYGNSSLRLGLTELSPHVGLSLGTDASGWTTPIYTVTPGLPGDSGSAVVSQDGEALGILVTLAIAPLAGSNGVTSLGPALDYARDHGMAGVALADGDAFTGNITSVLGGLLD